jgi:hypothetical protein
VSTYLDTGFSSAAACVLELLEDGGKASLDEADKLMKAIPSLTKKIAGKSLPIEVGLPEPSMVRIIAEHHR